MVERRVGKFEDELGRAVLLKLRDDSCVELRAAELADPGCDGRGMIEHFCFVAGRHLVALARLDAFYERLCDFVHRIPLSREGHNQGAFRGIAEQGGAIGHFILQPSGRGLRACEVFPSLEPVFFRDEVLGGDGAESQDKSQQGGEDFGAGGGSRFHLCDYWVGQIFSAFQQSKVGGLGSGFSA